MPPGSGVWITTAHRAKGQEFDEVHLWDDFADPAGSPPPEDEEVNLLYMAVTRARHRLMLNAATWNWWQRTG
jgi:superfamily I DNA/RNA helicase